MGDSGTVMDSERRMPEMAQRMDRVRGTRRDGTAATEGSRKPRPPREAGRKARETEVGGRECCWVRERKKWREVS